MDTEKNSPNKARRFPFKQARMAAGILVFAAIVVGLIAHVGWGTISSMGYKAIALVCPLGVLETLVAGGIGAPRFVIVAVVVVLLVVLFGRAFCSWVCPVPPVQRFLAPKRSKLEAPDTAVAVFGVTERREIAGQEPESRGNAPAPAEAETSTLALSCEDEADIRAQADALMGRGRCAAALAPVGGKRDGVRIDARHGVLAGALLSSAVFGFPVFCLVCPVGLTIGTFLAVWQAFVQQTPTWSLVVFPTIIVLELAVLKRWCHTLCPMSALMSLLGAKGPVLKPRVDKEKCLREKGVDCRVCVGACPEAVDPHSALIGECSKCGACAEKCPTGAISLGLFAKRKRR